MVTKLNNSISIAGNSVGLGDSLSANTLKESLGLSSAMRFIGTTTSTMQSNTSPTVTIGGQNVTAVNGDVVIENSTNYEYV